MSMCTVYADAPGPPQNLSVENVTTSSCTLVWNRPLNDGGSEIKGYYVERSSDKNWSFVKVNRDLISKTQETYTDLEQDRKYEYRVLAVNEAGIGKPSETISVVALPLYKPGKPRALRVKEIIKDKVTIEWEAPESDGGAPITHYVVKARHILVLFKYTLLLRCISY